MRGRIPTGVATSNVTFTITDKTSARLAMLVHDPVAGRGRYGLKSYLVEELLKRLFHATVKGEDSINVRDLRLNIKP